MITIDSASLLLTISYDMHKIRGLRMFRLYPTCSEYEIFDIMCETLNILKYNTAINNRIYGALNKDQLELVQWYYKHDNYAEYLVTNFYQTSSIRILRWLQTVRTVNMQYVFEYACKCGYTDVMDWAYPYAGSLPSELIVLWFVNINSYKWLLDHGATYNPQAINSAARQGSLEVVKMLHQYGECSPDAMLAAAKHPQIIKWMHANCKCGVKYKK